MKALDTNVLVRFLTMDDPAQSKKVIHLFRHAESNGERFHVSSLVLLELIWVLESLYRYERDDILAVFEKMLALQVLSIESPDLIESLLAAATGSKAELSDLLIGAAAHVRECDSTLTFDRKAAKASTLFQLLV